MQANALKRLTQTCRLQTPIGTFLLFWPCFWGYVLTLGNQWNSHTFFLVGVLFLGSFWMRSIGCAYNDWIDKSYDPFVQRTHHRWHSTLSTGADWCLFSILILMPGLFFFIVLPYPTLLWGAIGWLLSLVYPFLKRFIQAPQYFLGLLFSWGVWVGASLAGYYPWKLLLVYGMAVLWTVEYDTVYAYQDVEDDLKLGLKSLAASWGPQGKIFLLYVKILRVLALAAVLPFSWSAVGWCSAYGLFNYLEWRRLNLQIPSSCFQFFKRAVWHGFFISILFFVYT